MNAGVVRIEAGATLTDEYAGGQLTGSVDVIITTDGKFLIDGQLSLASKLDVDMKIFGDLSSLNSQNPNTPLTLVFLADIPRPSTSSSSGSSSAESSSSTDASPLVEIKGDLTLEFLDANGKLVNPADNPNGWTSFVFDLQGQAVIGASDTVALVIGGSAGSTGDYAEVKLIVTKTSDGTTVELDASGSLSIAGVLSAKDVVSAAGKFILNDDTNGNVELYGAAKMDLNSDTGGLAFLADAGLTVTADLTLAVNTSSVTHTVVLDLPGRPEESFSLAPQTFEIDGNGSIAFNNSALGIGADISIDGAFSVNISTGFIADNINSVSKAGSAANDRFVNFELFVDGDLNVGFSAAGQSLNFITLSALGLVVVRDIDVSNPDAMLNGQVTPELAGLVDLHVERNIPGVFTASGSAQLLLNTTGHDVTYQIPSNLLDTVKNIEAHRQNTSPSNVDTPDLPSLTQNADGTLGGTITISGSTYTLEHEIHTGPYFSLNFGDPVTSAPDPSKYTLKVMSWGDGSSVPTSGQSLLVVGTDSHGLLHIRRFDPAVSPATSGARTDTYETMESGVLHLVTADGSGKILTDRPESSLSSAQSQAITALKQQLPGLSDSQSLSDSQTTQILKDTTVASGHTYTSPGFQLTILDTFKLEGSFRIVADVDPIKGPYFGMAIDATASLAIPEAGNILNAEAIGILEFSSDGVFGALGFHADLALPGNAVTFKTTDYIGINTTTTDHTLGVGTGALSDEIIPAQSGEIYLSGDLSVGDGALDIHGTFKLLVGAQSLQMSMDGSLRVNGTDLLSISGDAAIYYGLDSSHDGLVLDASATLGDGTTSIGVKHIFSLGGSFTFHLDTRPASPRLEIAVDNAQVNILEVLIFDGSADISFKEVNGTPVFKVSGSFHGSFLGVFDVSASGWFQSDGQFDLNLSGDMSLGDHTFGIDAGASFSIEHTSSTALAFSGSAHGEVYGFGIDLAGADVSLSYDSNSGVIHASATVTVAGIDNTVGFDIGGLSIPTDSGPPIIATQNGGVLTLVNNSGLNTYSIDSTGGDSSGESITVYSQGVSSTFSGVTEIDGNFGTGSNTLNIGQSVGTYDPNLVVKASSLGTTYFSNLSNAAVVTFDASGSSSNSSLYSLSPDSTLLGGSGDDNLTGTSGDLMVGNAGSNRFTWDRPSTANPSATTIQGGSANDSVTIQGGSTNDSFLLSAPDRNGSVLSATFGDAVNIITLSGVGSLSILDHYGQNTAEVDATNLADSGLSSVNLDIHSSGQTSTATVVGTLGADALSAETSNADVLVTVGSLSVTDVRPASSDNLILDGHGGSDSFSITPPTSAQTDPGQLVSITLDGSNSTTSTSSTFSLALGEATIKAGLGSNSATFSIDSTSSVTLTSTRISSSEGVDNLTGIQDVTLNASAAAPITILSTPSGSTSVKYTTSGGSVDVHSAASPLTITLDGNADVKVQAASSTLTISDSSRFSGQNDSVTLGSTSGLLSKIAGLVTLTNIGSLTFDDHNDTANRTTTLNDTTLSGGGLPIDPTFSGATSLTYKAGKGTTTLNATAGSESITILGGAGSSTLNATRNNASDTGLITAQNLQQVNYTDSASPASTHYLLDGQTLSAGSTELLDASTNNSNLNLNLTLTNADNTLTVGAVDNPTTVDLGAGSHSVTIGGISRNTGATYTNLSAVNASLTLTASGASSRNTLTLDDSTNTSPVTRDLGNGSLSTNESAGTINYGDALVSSLTYDFGSGIDSLNLSVIPATTTINFGAGSDTLMASGDLGNLTLNGSTNGTADVTLTSAQGTVTYDNHLASANAAAQDKLLIDDSSQTQTLIGSLSSTSGLQLQIQQTPQSHP